MTYRMASYLRDVHLMISCSALPSDIFIWRKENCAATKWRVNNKWQWTASPQTNWNQNKFRIFEWSWWPTLCVGLTSTSRFHRRVLFGGWFPQYTRVKNGNMCINLHIYILAKFQQGFPGGAQQCITHLSGGAGTKQKSRQFVPDPRYLLIIFGRICNLWSMKKTQYIGKNINE